MSRAIRFFIVPLISLPSCFFFRWEVEVGEDWEEQDVGAIPGGRHTDKVLM